MKRVLDYYLNEWRFNPSRKSLLIRGARQVGKTFTTRQFGESFASSVEINFEKNPQYGSVFDRDFDPQRIVRDIALMCNQPIEPGRTLLFLDEIQQSPRALTALRYFSEEMPELHVIAAGSLIDFVIEEIGIPVGRVDSFTMYPMSFAEFLSAKGKALSIEAIMEHDCHQRLPEAVHQILLGDVAEYLAIGGMPEAVQEWIRYGDLKQCSRVHLLGKGDSHQIWQL
jgi:hypothetical protein